MYKMLKNSAAIRRYKAGGMIVSLLVATASAFSEVWTYDVPDGNSVLSSDYEMTVTSGAEDKSSFVYLSEGFDVYPRLRENGSLERMTTVRHKGPVRHSHSIFSFDEL